MAFDLVLRDVDHPDAATRAVISVASKRNRTFDELHRLRKRHVRLVVSIKVAPDECATRAGHGPVTFFEVAGLVLLVAIIAAVALTLRRRKDTKTQDIAEQVRTRAQDRVRIVTNMTAESGKKD